MNKNKCVKRIAKVYKGMKERCNNPNHIGYKYYGAKGIKVLISKKDFIQWYLDHVTDEMENPSVDRVKSHLHYSIDNIQILSLSDNSKKAFIDNPNLEAKIKNCKAANHKRKIAVTIDDVEFEYLRQAEEQSKEKLGYYANRRSITRSMKRYKTSNLKRNKPNKRPYFISAT